MNIVQARIVELLRSLPKQWIPEAGNVVNVSLSELERDIIVAALEAVPEAAAIIPPEVRIALKISLRHVEPGWTNCTTVAQAWLDEQSPPQ